MARWLTAQLEGRLCSPVVQEPEGYLLLHQLTTHNRIKYLCLHLEGPQSLVEWLGTRINQNEHKALGPD